MANGDNKVEKEKRRQSDRRVVEDRRAEVRFGDVLGRRTGMERRIIAS